MTTINNVTSFFIRGERCSGTNYLQKLIEKNFSIKEYNSPEWKHGYLNLGVIDNFSRCPVDYLMIFIFRNVFDWTRSFYLSPHHLAGTKSGIWEDGKKPTFSEFIRREPKIFDDVSTERNMDRHPYTLESPKNILELRMWKSQNYLNYQKLDKPVYYIKYEDLLINPEKILHEINDNWFNINFTFQNWDYYKTENYKYKPKKYFEIEQSDIKYIIDNSDWNLENKIGYYI